MPAIPPVSGQSDREDSAGAAGRRADREAVTRELSELLNQLRRASGCTWDEMAAAAHVSRGTVGNYFGDKLRNRDRQTLQLLLDAMHAPAEEQARALELLARTRADAAPRRLAPERLTPRVVGRVPELAASFQRRAEAEVLREVACPGTATVLTQGAGQAVVSGLGGVGKTQLAGHWARRLLAQAEVDVLVWVRASTATDIVTAYADAAVALELIGRGAGSGQRDLAGEARRFLDWLAGTDRAWAIVLDNLDEPGVIRRLWPPVTSSGRTVITTRRRDATLLVGRAVVDVEVFTPAAAAAFLTARLPAHLAEDPGAVEGVAQDLGRLPLALSHAAAYMIERDLPCARYRERFADRRRRLAELFPEQDEVFDDAAATVASTWALSIAAADALIPSGVAGRVLELVSLLDPAGIPLVVLTAPAALAYCEVSSADAVADAVANLLRFNLITHTTDGLGDRGSGADTPTVMVGVHALVQRAVRDHLDPNTADLAARAAADALLSCWPVPERGRTVIGHLRANTLTLREARNDALWTPSVGGHPVLFQVVNSLGNAGLVTAATTEATQLAGAAHALLGPEHPDTLTARGNLATWRGEAGDPAGAATAFEQLLTDRLRVSGPDHPDTLDTRGNLAYWRGEAGDPAGAATAFEQLLTDLLRVLGPDHPETLTARNNLAASRGEAGDPAGAAAAVEQLLTDLLRALGPDHPDTLTTRHTLAYWRGEAGDPAGAATAFEQLLTDRLRVLGPDHPRTLTARANLAYWRGEAGDPAGAATAFEQLLTDRLRVLGPDHPRTLTTRSHLTYWRSRASGMST